MKNQINVLTGEQFLMHPSSSGGGSSSLADIQKLTGTAGNVSPGGHYEITTQVTFTLGVEGAEAGKAGTAFVDITLENPGKIQPGPKLKLMSTLEGDKTNRCFVYFHGDFAELWVYGVRDTPPKPLTFTSLYYGQTNRLSLSKYGSPYNISLEYSVSGGPWNPYVVGTDIYIPNAGDHVSFRGDNANFSMNLGNYYFFSLKNNVMASGSIMSLLDSTCESKVIPCNYCFCNLFKNQMRLKSTPQLPATTLKSNCYNSMFAYCTNLISPPTLPATKMEYECYRSMLQGCTNFNDIEVAFTSWGDSCADWLKNTSSSGTFKKPADLWEDYGDNFIPYGWTVVNK